MKTIQALILALFLLLNGSSIASFAIPFVDSSGESSINFVRIKAVSSAKIVHFSWDVAAESSGDYFLLEKSIDDCGSWSLVARVESIENHLDRHTYEISEINMVEQTREYFRISRVDAFGNIEILDVVDINHPILSNMKLIPDPKRIKQLVTITCESLIKSDGSLYIYNEEGELISVQDMELVDGYNRALISLKNLSPGNYRVVVRNEFNDALVKRLVVY